MTYLKINNKEYIATFEGNMHDSQWNDRDSKSITTNELTFEDAKALFTDDICWFIVEHIIVNDEEVVREYDNSEYCVSGDITDHRNGYITIKMGKPTDLERAYEELYG